MVSRSLREHEEDCPFRLFYEFVERRVLAPSLKELAASHAQTLDYLASYREDFISPQIQTRIPFAFRSSARVRIAFVGKKRMGS